MRGLVLICVLCMQLTWSYGVPSRQQGVGAYAYQDSAGNRYGGTYGLKDGEVIADNNDNANIPFAPNPVQNLDDFFPEYFRNFETLLQDAHRRSIRSPFGFSFRRAARRRAFRNRFDEQNLALNAARKAYDLTSNRAEASAAYIPYFDPIRFNPFGFDTPGFGMPNFMNFPNSASSFAAAGPGFQKHNIAINPINPKMPNIDVTSFGDRSGAPGFYGVSSSSYSSSSNINGEEKNMRGGQTLINENGKITAYSLHD